MSETDVTDDMDVTNTDRDVTNITDETDVSGETDRCI